MTVGFNALMGLDLTEFGPDGGRAHSDFESLFETRRTGSF
jgi:hypothetical protein